MAAAIEGVPVGDAGGWLPVSAGGSRMRLVGYGNRTGGVNDESRLGPYERKEIAGLPRAWAADSRTSLM